MAPRQAASSLRSSGSASPGLPLPPRRSSGSSRGCIQPDSPMAGAITRSAPSQLVARAAAQQGDAGAQGHRHEGVGRGPAACRCCSRPRPRRRAPPPSRGPAAPARPRRRRRRRDDGRSGPWGGRRRESCRRRAPRRAASPSRKTTGSPVSTSVASTATGTRRPSKVSTGRNSSISAPSLRAREQPAAPAAHPHPGMQARGLVHELLEVGAPRPRPRPRALPR